MREIGVRELKHRLSETLRAVERGELVLAERDVETLRAVELAAGNSGTRAVREE